MKVKDIKEFLIMLLDKEMEEEYSTTDDKEWIASCIQAKNWLMDKKGIMAITTHAIIQSDIEKYLKEGK